MIQTLKNILLSAWYVISSRHYRILRKSSLFDADYYRRMNADVAATGADPLLHYLTRGFAELRQPGPFFDIQYYVKQVPELKEKGHQDPFIHFLREGWRAGIKPNFLFDTGCYVQGNPEVDFTKIDPVTHFLQQEGDACCFPYFDARFYTTSYQDVITSCYHPLEHFFLIGIQEKRRPSLYFDTAWYLDKTPVLLESNIDPLTHYFNFGIQEKKSPSPLFDPEYYAKAYQIRGVEDLFAHYMQYGVVADQRPCKWFDPAFYQQHYLEANTDSIASLAHYLARGVHDGLYPNKDVSDLPEKPIISLLVPVYNVTPAHLNNCIRSVLYQSYPHWELCLADDCSTREELRPLLEYWASQDSRIKVIFLDENLGISGATNAAATLATGSYLGFLDNDDELANDCLFTVVLKINSDGADLYYSDEDLIGEDGRQFSVFNKPAFNKELLLCHNYVTHFVVVEKNLYDKVGGFDSALDGAQDFDLFLKLSEVAKMIVHIPEVLYHWRASESSTSIHHDQKQYADEAGRKAVGNALVRREISAVVELTDWKFFYRIKQELAESPCVSIIILSQADADFEEWFAALLSTTAYPDTEFVVIADGEQQFLSLQQQVQDLGPKLRLLLCSPETSPAARYNEAVRQSRGQYIVFLNFQVQLQKSGWIEALLEHAMKKNSGVVGGRILPFQEDEYVTTVPDLRDQSALYYARFMQRCSQHMNGLQCAQDVLALSWDLAMVERERFLGCDGLADESFGHLFADSDLCLRMRDTGYENIYTPFAFGQWLRPEEKQPGLSGSSIQQEKIFFQKKWQKVLSSGDPYYNYGVLEQNGIDQNEFLKWYAGGKFL